MSIHYKMTVKGESSAGMNHSALFSRLEIDVDRDPLSLLEVYFYPSRGFSVSYDAHWCISSGLPGH